MLGVLLHVIGDALNNIGVIIAAVVIWQATYEGRFYADPGVSMGIAIMILLSALPLVKNSGAILLQSAPRGVDPQDVKHDLEKVSPRTMFWPSICCNTDCKSRFLGSSRSMSCTSGAWIRRRPLPQHMLLYRTRRSPASWRGRRPSASVYMLMAFTLQLCNRNCQVQRLPSQRTPLHRH